MRKLALLPFVLLLSAIATAQAPPPPKFTATLHAAAESVSPGGTVPLALQFDIEKGWHAYHPILLSAGGPLSIRFEVPAGVTFGPLQYPAPYYGEMGGFGYLGFEGQPVVLTTLRVADHVPAGPLTIRAIIDAQICKELCVPVQATASLTIPVAPGPNPPANQKLFEAAHENLPKPLAEAPYLRSSQVEVAPAQITPSDEGEIVVTIQVQRGHYIQDRDPGNDVLIASRVYVEEPEGLKLGDQQWPDPKVKENEFFGRVRTQSGTVRVRVPVRIIDREHPSGEVPLRVLVTYQACSEAGMCFPPETAEGLVTLSVETSNPTATRPLGSLYPRITTSADAGAPVAPPADGAGSFIITDDQPERGLWWYVIAAFVGGFILNVMPCVFPVISLKILSFVKQAGDDRLRILLLGLAFCAGIMVWFWIFAWVTSLGQIPLQSPLVVLSLIAILTLFGLNLFGVYEIMLPGSTAGKLDEVSGREGYTGAFLKGLLATLLGTACTAPFFAPAAAWASTQPLQVSFTVFSAAGAGMAFPYLVLSAFPQWLKLLPKPGLWMVRFKQAMGFILLGTAIWLLKVLGDQLGTDAVVWTLAFLTTLGFSAWLVGQIGLSWTPRAKLNMWCGAIAVFLGGTWVSYVHFFDLRGALWPPASTSVRSVSAPASAAELRDLVEVVHNAMLAALTAADASVQPVTPLDDAALSAIVESLRNAPTGDRAAGVNGTSPARTFTPGELRTLARTVAEANWDEGIPWQPFQVGLPEALAAAGYSVYVDFTATWCVTCHANKASSLEIASTKRMLRELRMIPLKADFTRPDPALREILLRHGRNSVPLNLVFAAGQPDRPLVLPALLTPGVVQQALSRAGGTTVAPAGSEPLTQRP